MQVTEAQEMLTVEQVKRWVKLVTHQKPMYVKTARDRMRLLCLRVYTLADSPSAGCPIAHR